MPYFILILALVLVLIFCKMRFWNTKAISKEFCKQNVIVYGKKGTGKDLIFAMVIRKRKQPHYSNVPYNEKTDLKPLEFLTVAPNTYNDFIADNIAVVTKNIEERKDYYLSDGGVYLPCQYDNILSKLYPSLPIFYALSRHLGNMNVHVNVQNLDRVWKKLKEQADCYIRTSWTFKLPRYMLVKTTVYENEQDASSNLQPIRKLIKGDHSKAVESARGHIKNRLVLIPKKWLCYDSRYFHQKVYGYPAPTKKELKKAKKELKKCQRKEKNVSIGGKE